MVDPEYVRLVKETEICKLCTNIVIGKGNLNADILFVGEAPGKNEDLQGIPFIGKAGKNLDEMLSKVGLSMEDVYITNILKCRPPMNRDPLPDEIRAHTPWLIEQIKKIRPKVICSLGNYATKFFLSNGNVDLMENQPGITMVHGKTRIMDFHGLKIKLLPLFHPAAIIYKRELLTLWEKDMEVVKKEVVENRI
ncbi:uracil-DNA glycosylase [Candidatus Pacearchaeota archaeon CG10_big_fil_rev_8_21_14_0_10_32_42]|nr:MAG: uracil-DNA glycosylase [Candidatus Pacearchaeota archaeon CG10_big_fil_rev_8_21_14_0_10_32_42]